MKMNFIDYREKLGLGFDDTEKYLYFKSFMLNLLYFKDDHYPPIYSAEECFRFCLSVGIKYSDDPYSNNYFRYVYNLLSMSKDLKQFLSYYVFFVCHFKDVEDKEVSKKQLIEFVEIALKASRIPYEIITSEGELFVFPKGAEELDEALINTPLDWLNDYPNSKGVFCRALKQYADGEHTRDVADNFRKAFEDFLKEFLNNEKDLDNNRSEICKYLKDKGADKNITNMLEPLLDRYKKINDDQVKHNDKLDPKFLEFLMYQTGLFIRMIITAGKEE